MTGTRNLGCLLATLSLPWLLCAQGGFNGPGRYEITNLKSGKVIDLDRNNQTTVIQFSSRNTDNQVWVIRPANSGYYFFLNGMNGKALDAPDNNNSAPVLGTNFNGGPSQQWRIEPGKDGNALIVSRYGKTLDVPDGTDRDGARLQIYDLNGDSNQRFMFRPVAGGRRGNFGGDWRDNAGSGARITCSSNNGSRVYCGADTSGAVQMVRQISGSPCRQGETWGYDSRGIWVDRGCRAEFEVAPRSGWRGADTAATGRITCSSDNGSRVYCGADTTGSVQMVRQISGSPCRQGETWGYDSRGIWVDRGCRAEFEVNPRARRFHGDIGGIAPAARITCSSDSGSRVYCQADTSGGVRMVRQISGSPCRQGETWGYDSRGIWVDRGCRAEFEAVPRNPRYRSR